MSERDDAKILMDIRKGLRWLVFLVSLFGIWLCLTVTHDSDVVISTLGRIQQRLELAPIEHGDDAR